jgi:hypothetical protein
MAKFGLWDQGKRKVWFNQIEIEKINKFEFDPSEVFEDPSSAQLMHAGSCLKRPKEYDEQMDYLKKTLNLLFN